MGLYEMHNMMHKYMIEELWMDFEDIMLWQLFVMAFSVILGRDVIDYMDKKKSNKDGEYVIDDPFFHYQCIDNSSLSMLDFIHNMQTLPNVAKLGELIENNIDFFYQQREQELQKEKEFKIKNVQPRDPLMTSNDLLIDLIHVLNCSINCAETIDNSKFEPLSKDRVSYIYLSVGILAAATVNDQIMHCKYQYWNDKVRSTAPEGCFSILIAEVIEQVSNEESVYTSLKIKTKGTSKSMFRNDVVNGWVLGKYIFFFTLFLCIF